MASPQSRFIPDFVQNGELKYNVTLTKIAKDLGGKDLRKLKFILAGPCGISKREMEKVTTAEDLFMCLKQRMMLTRDNLLFLQALLRFIDRTDLQEIVGDYAKGVGNTLYFYEAPRQPENNFVHVRFHVDGNLRSFERPTLEKLREEVAVLLDVPQEFIFLVGVEEGSVILTFMISEQYADQLKDLFEKHKDGFRQFGVDGIFVVDPPTVDEQSLDPRAEREESKKDFSTQTYLERAPVVDIQSQWSAIYDRQNQMPSQLGELKKTIDYRWSQIASQLSELKEARDDRQNQMTSQLGELKKTSDDRLSQMASQFSELKEAIDDRQNQMTSQLGELKETTGKTEWEQKDKKASTEFQEDKFSRETELEQKMAKASTEFQEDKFSLGEVGPQRNCCLM